MFGAGIALAGPPAPRVVLLPFEMHAADDTGGTRQERKQVMEALAGSLSDQGAVIAGLDEVRRMYEAAVASGAGEGFDEKAAIKIARSVGADFAVLGSLTKFEINIALDWRLLDVGTGGLVRLYYTSEVSSEALTKRITEYVPAMYERMLFAGSKRAEATAGSSTAQAMVVRITVEGMRRIDAAAVLKRLESAEGAEYSIDVVKRDIHNIYAMGYFDDLVVELADYGGGKELIFTVREKPFIKSVSVKGNDEVSSERVTEVLMVKSNSIIDRAIISEDAERIRSLYMQEGFYLADVSYEVVSEGLDAVVVYNVNEGAQVRVKRITILGNEAFSDKKLKKLFTTKEVGLFSFISSSGNFNEYVFENDLSNLSKHYYNNGYIRFDVKDHRVLLSEDKKWFYITISVHEDIKFRVGEVDVSGELLATKKELLKKLKLKGGKVFSRKDLSDGIDRMRTVYEDEGFANVYFDTKTDVDEEKKIISVNIGIKKNEPVYIERIDISGNTRTKDKVIRRELEFGEGELYSGTGLKVSRSNIRRLGYFDDVQIVRSEGSDENRVRLDVEVAERPTGMISFGMGYSTVDKVVLTASLSQSNFMGTGVKLNLSGTVSANSSNYVFGMTEPWLFDIPLSAGFDVFNTVREFPDFSLEKRGFDLRFGYPIFKRHTKAYLTYRLEDATITDVDAGASETIKEQEGDSTVSSATFVLRHDSRNDIYFPTEGAVVEGSVEYAGGIIGGTTNYVKYAATASKHIPVIWDTSFSGRVQLGFVESFDGDEVPLFERYFLGGINTVRGFETRTIGPRDKLTNEIIGGVKEVLFNLEYMMPIFPDQNVRGVMFFDAGNSYEGSIDLGDLRKGAGAGIRWFSPMGPLRVEWGYNLDRRTGERSSLWEFTIGGSF